MVCAGLRGLPWPVGIRQAPPNQEEAQHQHVVGQANVRDVITLPELPQPPGAAAATP